MTAYPYPLAASLARPVARGYLTLTEAHLALLEAALQAERDGCPYDPLLVYGGLRHILDLHLEQLEAKRAVTASRIRRRLKPLIALRKPSNMLLAEAHDVNGAEGFPFDEPGVNNIAVTEMYWALPPHHGRPRHGR